jgi:putative ABC transport system permease protein
VVDPATFTGVVRWDAALADRPLDDLMGALTGYDGDRVPVLVAGPDSDGVPADGDQLTLAFFNYYALPVEVVGRADAFPGQASRTPLLIADWDRITPALEAAGRDPGRVLDRQVWATGKALPVLEALTQSGYAYNETEVAVVAQFVARPDVRAQAWSLAYLRGMSLAAALLALVGIAMHALAQQRRRTVAGVLLSRMGMSRRSSDVAAALEIGLLTGLAALVAVAVALPASALVLQLLDPIPTGLPQPIFAVPWGSLAAVLGGVVLVTAGSALLVGRAARRAIAGEVMREGA